MNVCQRDECQTTAGCAHRGPRNQYCWFPENIGYRNAIIEECARLIECWYANGQPLVGDLTAMKGAAAIRALKDGRS